MYAGTGNVHRVTVVRKGNQRDTANSHHEAVGRMDDRGFKDFARVGERLIHGALADGSDLDQVLFGAKENDPEKSPRST